MVHCTAVSCPKIVDALYEPIVERVYTFFDRASWLSRRRCRSIHIADIYFLLHWLSKVLLMELARVGTRGQTTIPKRVRAAANLNVGDTLAFEVRADHLVVRKMPVAQDDYLHGLVRILGEWNSPEDEEAWRDL